jgi:hypothetical protein
MPKPQQPGPNRHHYRIWIKMAIQSGLIEKLPGRYPHAGSQSPVEAVDYARRLMIELRDPDASGRTLREIIADARQFKSWVEARRKDDVKRTLIESRPEDRIIEMPPGEPRAAAYHEQRPRRSRQPDPPDTNPKLHPLWDDWIDSMEM